MGSKSIPVLGMVDIKIPLNSYEFATVHAHVIDQLPVGTELILGQDFLRKHKCTTKFGKHDLRFTLTRSNRVHRINRLYSERNCKSPAHFADMTHSQLLATSEQSKYRAVISMIQRVSVDV